VIRGWGAAHLLKNIPHVIRVRICAPLETRVNRMMKRLATDNRDTVESEIQLSEEAHTAITKRHFGVNWRDPENYDLVLCTERLSVEECVDEIEGMMSPPAFQETDESRRMVENLSLEWSVRAALRREARTTDTAITVEVVRRGSAPAGRRGRRRPGDGGRGHRPCRRGREGCRQPAAVRVFRGVPIPARGVMAARVVLSLDDAIVSEVSLEKPVTVIGRHPGCDIVIDHPAISGRHMLFRLVNRTVYVEDLASTNGTRVNGLATSHQVVHHLDLIEVGRHKLHFFDEDLLAGKVGSLESTVQTDFERTLMARTRIAAAPVAPPTGTWRGR
jgi:hypothetical protein